MSDVDLDDELERLFRRRVPPAAAAPASGPKG